MKAIRNFILMAALCYLPAQSMAWGQNGHRIVGQIADSYLSAKARLEIKKILGNESIAIASTWADFVRSAPEFSYLDKWHYINLNKKFTYPEFQTYFRADTIEDAYTKTNFLVAELKKKSLPQEKKLMYLRLLIHIVGDIHQPMHAAHADDRGGNGFKVSWFGKPTNLHTVWDSELVEAQGLSYTEYAKSINFTTPLQRTEWNKDGVIKWLYDSSQIAEGLYTDIKSGDNLSYRYSYDHIAIVNQQLLKGGVRLAGVLNSIFAG